MTIVEGFFLVKKSESFAMFKNCKNLVEKETRVYLRVLRTDKGREFISKEFTTFYNKNGI